MLVPVTVTLDPGESDIDGAIRAAAETCDIEDPHAELQPIVDVPPVSLHLSETARALIYPLYATSAPPNLDSLEDADVEDEEDTYDWYTWPRAVNALRHDPRALDTLRTLACGIATAHQ